MRKLLAIWLVFWMVACSSSKKQWAEVEVLSIDTVHYAQGFSVERFRGFTAVTVKDPWDTTLILQRYLLVDRKQPVPADLPKGTLVRTPLQRVVVYSSVHVAMIEQLGATEEIIGVCEPRYIDSPFVQEGVKKGRIANLGESTAPNVEKMIEIGAEVIIASPFQNSSYGPVEKIGVPIIEGADYMEDLPLGRTEWIRFYGLLFQKEQLADSIFQATEQSYMDLKELTKEVKIRPTVLSEKRYGASWFVPTGNSYMAHLFADAGADYIYKDLEGRGSIPLSFESVFEKALHANLWLVKYNQENEMTYNDLQQEYTPYRNFDAFQKQHIYTCNTGKVPYYEEFPLHPDYLLKDLIWIFHPELLLGYEPRYYRKME